MSFKHLKFDDSEVMRSLARVGVEKGIVKEASTKTKSIHELVGKDLSSSNNLEQDIIKLCDGLRHAGFNKQASELESRFIMWKKADTMYQVSKEKGEDLIHAAHPEGSHKLKGVSGDNAVRTVIDRRLAFLKLLNKEPTGKLSTAKEIIGAVKIALADGEADHIMADRKKYAVDLLKGCKNWLISSLSKDLSTGTTDATRQKEVDDSVEDVIRNCTSYIGNSESLVASRVNNLENTLWNTILRILKPYGGFGVSNDYNLLYSGADVKDKQKIDELNKAKGYLGFARAVLDGQRDDEVAKFVADDKLKKEQEIALQMEKMK
jgi:hypothetical protein